MDGVNEVFEAMFQSFKESLANDWKVTFSDDDKLRKVFLAGLPNAVDATLEGDAQSGNGLEDVWGEEILECIGSYVGSSDDEDDEDEDEDDGEE